MVGESEMIPYVFISYKAEEYSEAKWVKDRLEASGIPCWMAPASIPGGSNYALQIPRAIRGCQAFVVILSRKAQQSKWVPRELDQAINSEKLILPFCIDNSPLRDDFAFYLANVQRYEAWQDREGALRSMIRVIRSIRAAGSFEGQPGGTVRTVHPAEPLHPVEPLHPADSLYPADSSYSAYSADSSYSADSLPSKGPDIPVQPAAPVRKGTSVGSGTQGSGQGSVLKKVIAAVLAAAVVIVAAGLFVKFREQDSGTDSQGTSDGIAAEVPESDHFAADEGAEPDTGEATDTLAAEADGTDPAEIPEAEPSTGEETVSSDPGQTAELIHIDYNTRGTVRILNKKEEKKLEFEQLASRFHQESGINVTVETPGSGNYSKVLKDELTGSEHDPTLFMLGGLKDFEQYGFECLELGGTAAAQELEDESYTLKGSNGKIYGLACIVEAYGLVVNTRLLKKAGYEVSDIRSFSDLKRVAEDITARKKELGFSAFTAPSVSPGVIGDYRFAEHAADVPLYYELKDNDFNIGMSLRGTYTDGLRDYIDLYLDNAAILRGEASSRSLKDAQEEFLLGKAVFHQDGSWNTDVLRSVLDYEAAVIPLYMGMPGEENQGINETFSYFWCVNKYAKEDDIEATLQFLQWLVTSEEGLRIMTKDMGFQIPYKRAEAPDDIFMETLSREKEQGIEPVGQYYKYGKYSSWINSLKNTIRDYADGRGDWEAVREAFTSLW